MRIRNEPEMPIENKKRKFLTRHSKGNILPESIYKIEEVGMDNKSLKLLGKVFAAEIEGALSHGIKLFQTKSRLAQKLENDGYLVKEKMILGGRLPVIIEGYRLTIRGNMTYCMSKRDG